MEKRIAVMADIHGNYAALAAVLQEIENDPQIDQIYCLGDLIGIGYETNEVLGLLATKDNITYVMGNHDEAIIDIIEGREPYSKGNERKHHEWIASMLEHQYLPFLKSIPTHLYASYNGKILFFQHYHVGENGNFLKTDYEPTAEKLDQQYQDSDADVVCFGHHHVVHLFKSRERLYLNPSSLGCYHKPLAAYAVLTIGTQGEINIFLREVPYDNKEFLLGYKKLNVPDADYILKIFHGNQHLYF